MKLDLRKLCVWLGLGLSGWAFVFTAAVLFPLACRAQGLEASSPEELAGKAFDAFAVGDWWALGAVAVFVLTMLVKSGVASAWMKARWPKTSAFVDDPRVSFFLPVALAGVPGVFTAIKSGQPFTVGLLVGSIVKVSGGAKMIFLGWKNFTETKPPVAPPLTVMPEVKP